MCTQIESKHLKVKSSALKKNNTKIIKSAKTKIIKKKNQTDNKFQSKMFLIKRVKAPILLIKPEFKPITYKNTWLKVLPTSCKVNPLYFTTVYPWTYRMSAKISNYYFGKKPIHNLLTFNINLPVKHQLRGMYFFSNYDTTNYGKLEGKNIPLYRLYPSLYSASLIQSNNYVYKPFITNCNLAYLPLTKYSVYQNNIKLSGNWWFVDNLNNVFLRKYHNIQSHNIMSKEIDSVISMFDVKLAAIFNPISAAYNLQRTFTLGLSPRSQVFMPHKYLRSQDSYFRRFNLWSNKYYNFWNHLQQSYILNNSTVKLIIDYWAQQLTDAVYQGTHINFMAKLHNRFNLFVPYLNVLNLKNSSFSSKLILLDSLKQKINNLYNNIFHTVDTNKLCVNIKQGTSTVANLVFSTKNLVVINSRYLYHYYPYYTKRPYGTGIKQTIYKKSVNFSKNKVYKLKQLLKLTHISHNKTTVFSRIQQLAKWMNFNKFTYFNHTKRLLDVLTLNKNSKYLSSLVSNANGLGLTSFKPVYQQLLPLANKWQAAFNQLQLYNYLTHYKNHIQLCKPFKKGNKWFFHHKHPKKSTEKKTLLLFILIVNIVMSALNQRVEDYLISNKSEIISQANVWKKIQELKDITNDDNWLKFFLVSNQRQALYDIWADMTVKNKQTAILPAPLVDQGLLVNGISDYLINYPQFYQVYNLFNKYLDFLHEHELVFIESELELPDSFLLNPLVKNVFNIKNNKKYLDYFKNIYVQSLIYQPIINVKEEWSIPLIVKVWRLSLFQWQNIVKKKKGLWFSAYNNSLDWFQQQEKQIYLAYERELERYKVTYKRELRRIQALKWLHEWEQQEKLEQQKAEQEKLEQHRLQQQRLQQQKAEQQRLKQQKLHEKQKNINKMISQLPLGAQLPKQIWRNLTEDQRTFYHIQQKNLKKAARDAARENDNKKTNKSI